MSDFVESMFSYREPPWHGKGVILDRPATAREAIKQAGLDWQVELRPICVSQDGTGILDYNAVVRTDVNQVLGVVGNRYVPVQNRDLFGFMDPVVSDNEAIYHTGGSLKDGRVVWLLAKLPDTVYVHKDDAINSYVLLASSHDGSMPVTAMHTSVRVVCWNTLSVALAGRQSVRIRHVQGADQAIRIAHQAIGLSARLKYKITSIASTLLSINMGARMLKGAVDKVFPTKKEKSQHLERIEALYVESPGILEYMRGTAWAAYNAICEYLDYKNGDPDLYKTWFNAQEKRDIAMRVLLKQDFM